MTTQINQLTELTTTSDDDLILIRENSTGIDKRMKAQNIRAKATTKDDVGLGNVDNVSAANLRDRSTHTGTQTLATISDAGTIASQNANNVAVTGGTINNTPIGGTTANTGNFTNLAYTGTLTGGTGVVNLGSGQVVKDASGNVGIGTTSPSEKLQVSGNISQTGGGFLVQTNGTNTVFWSLNPFGISNSFGISTGQSIPFIVGNNNTERMRIDSNGRVGIGTTAPNVQLTVNQEMQVNGIEGRNISGNISGVSLASNGTYDFVNFSGLIVVNNYANGHNELFIVGGGNVTSLGIAGSNVDGTLTFNPTINGYTFTNTSGQTIVFGFFGIRTRPAA